MFYLDDINVEDLIFELSGMFLFGLNFGIVEIMVIVKVVEGFGVMIQVCVFSDCQIVVKVVSCLKLLLIGKGLLKINCDLWLCLQKVVYVCVIIFEWVCGYSGNVGNNIVYYLVVLYVKLY